LRLLMSRTAVRILSSLVSVQANKRVLPLRSIRGKPLDVPAVTFPMTKDGCRVPSAAI
jgi:hypothetical protein